MNLTFFLRYSSTPSLRQIVCRLYAVAEMSISTTRILTLIPTPLPHRLPSFSPFRLPFSFFFLSRLHSSTLPPSAPAPVPSPAPAAATFPWPEWSHFVNRVSVPVSEVQLDEFAASAQFTPAFLNDAAAFLAFAKQHPSLFCSLPIEDIEVIIENVSPSLFKDAHAATSRMRSFLLGGATHVPESDRPSTVDLMKFLLSYVHMAIVSSEEVHRSSKVESSVRKLFAELVKTRGTSPESVASVHTQFPEDNDLGPISFGNNTKMKRGDWICTRCSFMNFAKNKNCLKCVELRPKKFLTGGEWECPQCDFFNFGRNAVCLRCDCQKPKVSPLHSPTAPATLSGLGAKISSVKSNTVKPIAGSEGNQQPWLTKITQLEKSSDLNSFVTDEEFSKFMQTGDNRVSSRSSNPAIDGTPDGVNLTPSGAESNINADVSQSLGELLAQTTPTPFTSDKDGDSGESRSASDEDLPETMPMRTGENRFVVSKKKDRSLTSPMYKRRVAIEQAGSNNHVPFVPFPPNYFAQEKPNYTQASVTPEASKDYRTAKHSNSNNLTVASKQTGAIISDPGKTGERNEHKPTNSYEASPNMDQTSQFSNSHDRYSKPENSSGTDMYVVSQAIENTSVDNMPWRGRSLEGSAVKELDPLDMSEEAKAERWFRRVAQIKDISELTQIPDEDFPTIMPLRKGVNRFVISKRKTPLERRLTSSQYQRNLPVDNSEPNPDKKGVQSS